jgi:hypothetical protein
VSTNNYLLKCAFGKYPPGEVVPAHLVEVGHDVEFLLARGLVEPTDKPTTVALVAPEPVKPAEADSVEKERDRLAAENKALRQANAECAGAAKALERDRDAFQKKCDEYTAKIVHLEAACEDHQTTHDALAAENTKLKADLAAAHADLDAATRPAAAPKAA